jgi:hypothetical protein
LQNTGTVAIFKRKFRRQNRKTRKRKKQKLEQNFNKKIQTEKLELKSKEKNSRRKTNYSSSKGFYRGMTEHFIEFFSIIGGEFIDGLCMKSGLIPHIHSIVDDDDRENETHEEFIAHWSIFESHGCGERDNKC